MSVEHALHIWGTIRTSIVFIVPDGLIVGYDTRSEFHLATANHWLLRHERTGFGDICLHSCVGQLTARFCRCTKSSNRHHTDQ